MTIVSDGGLKNKGSFGWIIADNEEIFARCRGPAGQERRQMSSFRPEATGFYSALLLVAKLSEKCELGTNIEAWTNNLALVRRVSKMCQNNLPIMYSKIDSILIFFVSYL